MTRQASDIKEENGREDQRTGMDVSDAKTQNSEQLPEQENADHLDYEPLGDIENAKGMYKVKDWDDITSTWRWKVENVRELKGKIYSPTFAVAGHPWRLLLFPQGNSVNSLSVYLDVADAKDLPQGWSRYCKFNISVLNQKNLKQSVSQDAEKRFNAQENDWGFREFIPLHNLYSPSTGFLVDNYIVIDISVNVCTQPYLLLPASYDSRTETGYVGLKNQGATCYLNSLLQTLYHLALFRKKVYLLPASDNNNATPTPAPDPKDNKPPRVPLGLALQRVFYRLQNTSNHGSVDTKELTRAFGWDSMDSFMQHDVQELARVLCDNLETKFNQCPIKELHGTIQNLFQGKLLNYIKCVNVNYESKNEEAFYDLQLNVKGCKNIIESFEKYIEVETLEGDNQYRAEGHGLQDAKKGTIFKSFPPILMLHLKRFEYDVMRDCMYKVNDRYVFDEEINLNKFVENPSADPDDNSFVLFSVLVHAGDVHGGHYFAFTRPHSDAPTWYKFDDERVYKVNRKDAIDDNFGGEEEIKPFFNFWGNTRKPLVFKKSANAYMLVYVKKKELGTVLKPVPEEEVPEHLRQRFEQEKEEDEKRKKEKAEAHKYTTVKIITDSDIKNNTASDLARVETIEAFKFKKAGTITDLKKHLEEKLNIPVNRLRLWKWEQRQNKTSRPDSPISNENVPLEKMYNMSSLDPLAFYLEVLPVSEEQTETAPPVSKDSILLFFKFYDPSVPKLEYVGNILVRQQQKIGELTSRMIEMAHLPSDVPIIAFEEIRPTMIEPIDPRATLRQAELQHGDIVTFQVAPRETDKYEYSKAPDYYTYLLNRISIRFAPLDKPKEITCTLELLKNMPYENVTRALAQELNSQPQFVRLTGHSPFADQVRSTPFKTTDVKTLKDMIILGQHYTDILYYEILTVPITELESKKALTIHIFNSKVEEANKEQLLLPKEFTVAQTLQKIQDAFKFEGRGVTRLLEIYQGKVLKVLPYDEVVDNIHDYPNMFLRAEEIPEDELNFAKESEQQQQIQSEDVIPNARIVQVVHFAKDYMTGVRVHGQPFYLLVRKDETAAQVRERIRNKLGIEKEEFDKWKLASIYLNKSEYVQDDEKVLESMKKMEVYKLEGFLGLEHKDAAPRAASRWYDKPIKIYN